MAVKSWTQMLAVSLAAASLTGCANMKPSALFAGWGRGQQDQASANSMAEAESLLKQNSPKSRWSLGSSLGKISDAMTIQPQRSSTPDAITLANSPRQAPIEVYLNVAKMSESRGNIEAAEKQYLTAVERYPKDEAAAIGFARFLDRQHRDQEALQAYQRVLQDHPNSAVVQNDLGLFHARHDNLVAAAEHLKKAVELSRQRPLYCNNLAKVMVASNQIDAAREQLLKVGPPEVAEYNIGVLLHQLGRTDDARGHLQAALQANPQFTAAQEMLSQLPGAGPVLQQGPYMAQRLPDLQQQAIDSRAALGDSAAEQAQHYLRDRNVVQLPPTSPPARLGPYVGEPSPAANESIYLAPDNWR